jgi:hypothetical protein
MAVIPASLNTGGADSYRKGLERLRTELVNQDAK